MTQLVSHTPSRRLSPQTRDLLVLLAVIVAMILLFGFARPQILSFGNLQNVAIQATYLTILACAQTIVIMTRGFDLSLGVTVSLVSVTSAMAMTAFGDIGPVAAILSGVTVGLGCALAVSAFNGLLIANFGLNPFIVTLATMYIVLTLSTTVSGGFPVSPLPVELGYLSTGRILSIPVPVVVAAVALILLQVLLTKSVFGRSVILIGTNARAAEVAGVRVKFHLFAAYLFCGFLIGIGSLLLTARTGSGEPNLGGDLTLLTIAAAVLGGVRLRGGEGNAAAPLLGAVLVTVLSNGMNLMAIDGYLQQVLLGIVIIVALAVDRLRNKEAR